MGFNKFKKDFEEKFEEGIYDFIDETENGNIAFKGELQADLDQENFDSYGYEDSKLRRIFFFPDYNIYVEFHGTRQSYSGEEWYGFKEVIQKTKTISVWEQTK